MLRVVPLLCLVLCGLAVSAQETPTFGQDMEVGDAVSFSGVVLYASGTDGMWVYDGRSSVPVNLSPDLIGSGATVPNVGNRVEVRGEIETCKFRPCVLARALQVTGSEPLPAPTKLRFRDVLQGKHFGEWVEVEAPVRQVFRRDGNWWLRLASGAIPAAAVMPYGPTPSQGQLVRWRGVVGAAYDGDRRYLGLLLHVPNGAYAEPLADQTTAELPVVRIDQVGQAGAMPGARVRVRGRLTFTRPGYHFFLEDQSGALVVLATPPSTTRLDAPLEVTGTVTVTERGPSLTSPSIVSLGPNDVPELEPPTVSPAALARGQYARRLVVVEGEIDGIGRYKERTEFTLHGPDGPFEVCAHDERGGGFETDLDPGSRIRVTGVSDARLWESDKIGPPYTYWVEMQEPRSIEVLATGAFLTTDRLAMLLGAALIVGLAAALWAWSLRRRVRVRTAELLRERDQADALRLEAQAADRAKSAFLANMSHEIRTPLTAIIGFAQLMEESGADPDLSGRIERAGLRLLSTINSVLTFARLEAGRTDIKNEAVEVAPLVRQAIDSLRPLALTKNLSLALAVDAGAERARAVLDASHFGRVLNNLIGNAVKFTDTGAVAVRVRVDTDRIRVVVSDTGPGIDDAFLPRLFGEFEQETTGERRRFEGSGLGLAITKRLVDAMGGEISVETASGRGTAFTVTFARVADTVLPSGDGAAAGDPETLAARAPQDNA